MDTAKFIEMMRGHPLVEGAEDAHLAKLSELGEEVLFEKGALIFPEGRDCNQFYVVLAGSVALETHVPGHTVRIQTLGPADELGWSAVLMAGGRFFQATALTSVRLLAFDGSKLSEACDADPGFGYAFMRRLGAVVETRLEAARTRLRDTFSAPVGAHGD